VINAGTIGVSIKLTFSFSDPPNNLSYRKIKSYGYETRPVLALAPSESICRQLALPWDITPILSKHYESIEQLMLEGLDVVKEKGLVNPGDTAVIIFGTSLMPGATDVMKVHRF
jgi:pyruvate kinase